MVPNLLKRFSSREGYRLFDDVLPTCELKRLVKPVPFAQRSRMCSQVKRLHELGVKTGLVSNTDLRIRE